MSVPNYIISLVKHQQMIGGTISTPSYPTCSSLSELAGPPLVRISFVKVKAALSIYTQYCVVYEQDEECSIVHIQSKIDIP